MAPQETIARAVSQWEELEARRGIHLRIGTTTMLLSII